ncbi:MAG TPA: MaoC/PaaZ C-terminal domain-containing protein [Aliidongia sp.]|uniref:MaoC/PaaZ C-terminal domain-containing protein n=1 Tax=Aliidongia sp. TaxID=1914230 RepID=UPI002DDCC865|nr:MaoC/PaaZ C-terminal domain-containing protein [Aliidongia sp.]HEV2677554.1 MaoC/PaaZ C-terminal domain-containing protein [Aliidongia sp.]
MALGEGLSPDLASAGEVAAWQAARRGGNDVVTAGLVERFHATLGRPILPGESGDPAPLGLHWCLAPEAVEADSLGPDGLPADGGIIPPIRILTGIMWGGGEIAFQQPLRVGDPVERVSRLVGLTEKNGRSGRLVFARLQHEYVVRGQACVSEVQTIAFRNPVAAPPPPGPDEQAGETWDFSRTVTPTETMLFRFSALTFNPHRIHYDQPYATAVEHFPGLVVHGPLTAALLLDACAGHVGGEAVARFRVKAERPAYGGNRLTLAGRVAGEEVAMAALDEAGRVVMRGTATLRR